jgi:hypothetical protein
VVCYGLRFRNSVFRAFSLASVRRDVTFLFIALPRTIAGLD